MKTCLKCGYTTENDQAKFCKKCGANFPDVTFQIMESPIVPESSGTQSINVSNISSTESTCLPSDNSIGKNSDQNPLVEQEPVITPEYLKENSEIGGWLAFFLFSICLGGTISAVMSFTEMNSSEYQNSILLVLADVSIGVMLCGLAFYTLYSFVQRMPDSVYLGKLYVVTTFLSNLLLLFIGEYDVNGLGSLPQIIRGLVWGVIWYAYLCVSTKVEEVIPKDYRRKSVKDYIITCALFLIPIMLFAAGIVELLKRTS